MFGVDIWRQNEMNTADNLIILYDDRDAFDYCSDIYNNSKVYKLGKNSGTYANLICAVIAISNYLPSSRLPKNVLESREYKFVSTYVSAIESFSAFNKQDFIQYVNNIKLFDCKEQIYDKALHLIDILNDMFSVISGGIYEDGIFYNSSIDCWWKQAPFFGSKLSELYVRLEGSSTPIKRELQDTISQLQRQISVFSGRDTPKKLKVVSAYFMLLAKHFYDCKNYTISYLALHRAIDLYFTSIGIENGLIRELRDFFIYHDDNPDNYRSYKKPNIYLYKTYKNYVSIILSLGVDLDSYVTIINKKRNKLMFTHGVESASMDEAKIAYKKSMAILEKDSEWCRYKSSFVPNIELKLNELIIKTFSTDNHIDV